jgi:hypothetical protein
MESTTIKQEIHHLIDQEQDNQVLQAVYDLLQQKQQEQAMREEMTRRAMLAEEDIKAGRVYTLDEAQNLVRKHIFKWKS